MFIFLIDQSGSMDGLGIAIVRKALNLFMQSLPANSYYQLIGFGSIFVKYDEIPKEYNQKNIEESLKTIENLEADLGGTNIFDPLKDIYNSNEIYDKINLPKNIFILTDGVIEDKAKTLDLIEKNNSKFHIFSIGFGDSFDKELIIKAAQLGKGNYNFCKKLDGIYSIIASEINNSIKDLYSNLNIKTSLDNENLVKNSIPDIIRGDQKINLNYIINDKNKDINNKINIEVNCFSEDENKNIELKYEIIPEEIPEGEELSKLIINYYLNDTKLNLFYDKKLETALKYQILNKNTCLFAEIELSKQISEEMKLKIIGDNENNKIKKQKPISNYTNNF